MDAIVWAALAVAMMAAAVRWAHGWALVAGLGGERRRRLPPGDMGWPVVGAMWAFLRAFKSGEPDAFIASFVRRCQSQCSSVWFIHLRSEACMDALFLLAAGWVIIQRLIRPSMSQTRTPAGGLAS